MRRVLVVLCSLALVVTSALPAMAAKPEKETYESRSAEAGWSTIEWTGKNTYTETWTWVWAYEDQWGGGVWVDQDVLRCRTGQRGDTCRYGGYTSYWGEGGVTVAADLSSASVTTTVTSEGRTARSLPLEVSWTGTGSIFKSRGTWSGGDDCFSYRSSYRGQSRNATATGTLDGRDLGTSEWGSIGESAERWSYRDRCGIG